MEGEGSGDCEAAKAQGDRKSQACYEAEQDP